jgi:hypothetical protein
MHTTSLLHIHNYIKTLKHIYILNVVSSSAGCTSQHQDWNLECKDIESRRESQEFEKGDEEQYRV